jgi:ribosomal protein S18 acetylase RimI-like enzyme
VSAQAIQTHEAAFTLAPITDSETLSELLCRRWGETLMMFGRIWREGEYQGIGIFDNQGVTIGLATFAQFKTTLLALSIDNFSSIPGVGKALLAELKAIGLRDGARALRVLTTNDNTYALRFFQMQGFRMVAFYPGAIAVYRTVSPTLPEFGLDGIPVRDAIELEIDL